MEMNQIMKNHNIIITNENILKMEKKKKKKTFYFSIVKFIFNDPIRPFWFTRFRSPFINTPQSQQQQQSILLLSQWIIQFPRRQ